MPTSEVAPLASKTVALGVTGEPKKIMRTIDAGLDAFLSVTLLILIWEASALRVYSLPGPLRHPMY